MSLIAGSTQRARCTHHSLHRLILQFNSIDTVIHASTLQHLLAAREIALCRGIPDLIRPATRYSPMAITAVCLAAAAILSLHTATVTRAGAASPPKRWRWAPDPPLEHEDFTARVPPEALHWDTLDARISSDDKPKDIWLGGPEPEFHWVIVSCMRPHHARVLTSTLASAWLNGMKPTTITIVWCKRYNASEIPPVLYNLRHSKLVKVVFLPDNLYINPIKPTQLLHPLLNESRGKDNPTGVYFTALSVPLMYNRTDIPLLITEDDVHFAPDFNRRLAWVVGQALNISGTRPYFVQLYNMGEVQPLEDIVREFNSVKFRDSQQELKLGYYSLGNQALLYSPDMAKFMAKQFSQVAPDYPEGATDILVFESIVSRFYCAKSMADVTTQRCVMFRATPSLIQHAGFASSLFSDSSGNNKKFHVAWDFPVKLALSNKAADMPSARRRTAHHHY